MSAPKYKLSLFITKETSGKALAQLYKALEVIPYTDYQLRMVDVGSEPERAKNSGVTETPLLIYHSPDGDKRTAKISNLYLVREFLGIAD